MTETNILRLLQALIRASEPPELGPNPHPGVETVEALNEQLDVAFKTGSLAAQRQDLIRATILLWHDHLDASHRISQSIETADGSYVHGIMHRREPDYGNSKYWFRRVGAHPCFEPLAAKAGELLRLRNDPDLAGRLLKSGVWDPLAFVDACEAAAELPAAEARYQTLRAVQAVELKNLLEYFSQS